MVTDFRKVGQVPRPTNDAITVTAGKQGLQVISLSLYSAAAVFLVGGLWLIFGTQTLFAPDTAQFIGLAFIISAITDVIAVKVVRTVWAKRARVIE